MRENLCGQGLGARSCLWIAVTAWLAMALASTASAIVPGQVSFQGLLLDDLGAPVTSAVAMDFELFDAAAGGTSLWTESHPAVQVVDGVYQVNLGETTPLTAALVEGGNLHLEITVDGETLTPRQQLLVVPYALRSAETDQVGGFDATYMAEMIEHFSFDGGEPGNLDAREGLADTDNDGLANFVDADNDNDGLSDGFEIQQGSEINLATPTITGFSPPIADALSTTTVTVLGTSFAPGVTVVFGSESPTPSNITSTSFDVQVGPQPHGIVAVTVTLPNAESAVSSFELRVERVIFVTSNLHGANLGGISGADATCNSLASAAGLPGSFQAWLADSFQSPSTRESQLGAPYLRTDGTIIADDWADLVDGDIDIKISRDESGASVGGTAWTNVAAVGGGSSGVSHCDEWTSTTHGFGGRFGYSSSTSGWTEGDLGACSETRRLYCVEQ